MRTNKQHGFTIVELLIVIVVIAILAAISIVAYNGIQQRARDSIRKDHIAKISKAMQLWSIKSSSDLISMNAGASGTVVGYFDSSYSTYPSIKSVLVSSGDLTEGVVDPINYKGGATNTYTYMVAPCETASISTTRVILSRMEVEPKDSLSQQLGRTCTNGTFTSFVSGYGMNYGVMVSSE